MQMERNQISGDRAFLLLTRSARTATANSTKLARVRHDHRHGLPPTPEFYPDGRSDGSSLNRQT